ncbi:MAG: hypothetical protein A2Y31_05490 [Spirochaetes bacterium GWC2_52_13]|nr:MAG: hypothetical protein A2Y31_05490 [Spirochaetes bacterium GWC2_52_13]
MMNVLITGASGGLGRALTIECARRGYHLFLTDINKTGLESLRNGVERQFPVVVATMACDLTDDTDVDRLLAHLDTYGIQFDMLLNVAGLDFEGGFLEQSRKNVLTIVSLNICATLRITHAILSRRAIGKSFSLVFVSSLASQYPIPLKATYAASKRFLLDFAYALGEELKNRHVHVLAVCPGGLVTTRDAMDGIKAQGIWGDMTTNRIEVVTRNTIDRALAGKLVYIPGIANRILSLFGHLLPRTFITMVLYKRWTKSQGKWLDIGA